MAFDENKYQMVQFCIPPLGTRVQLAKPWTFDLYNERRNEKLIETLGFRPTFDSYWRSQNAAIRNEIDEFNKRYPSGEVIKAVTLPAGTILRVSRIYIRQPFTDYDSVTFSIKKGECPQKGVYGRFWSKLKDVNRIISFPIGETHDVFESHIQAGKELRKDRFDFL